MEPATPLPEHGALLAIELGADQTHVTLVDLVADSYRLVAHAVAPSTFGPPASDPTIAIRAALREIETITSRELLRGDDLIYPQDEAGNGVDSVVATTSAAGVLNVAVAGIAEHASVRSVTHAVRSTYTHLIDTIALAKGGPALGAHVPKLAAQMPDVVVVAGGVDGGATSPNVRLAQLLALLTKHAQPTPLIVLAGNAEAVAPMQAALSDSAPIEVVENVLPQPKLVRIEPVRALLRRVYRERNVAKLPGGDRLKQLRCERLGSVAEDQGLMVRFLAQRFKRNVLALTADGDSAAALLMSDGHYSEAIFGRLGTRGGALSVLAARGFDQINRWLPFDLDETTLRNRLLNRVLRPHQVPSDMDDLMLDYALLRESVGLAYRALRDERPQAQFDLVIASGALAASPRPGLAALAILDAIEPTSQDSDLAINLYLDQWSLLAASGALAHVNADAAACLLEQDALNNQPLATVIVPRGDLTPGKKIAEVELTPHNGQPLTRTVNAGEIVRLPLSRGKRATLRIKPVGGIAIGKNKVGAEVLSDEAAIVGSALGVVIDARPRPLTLPADHEQRRATVVAWMEALSALPPAKTFAPTNGTQPANGSDDAEAVLVDVGASGDVGSLREELVQASPPKHGLFGRK